ncbi:MAG: BACON domain-containing protein [Ardenticatenaceae bacterium]
MCFRLCRVVLLALGVFLLVSGPSYEAFAGDGVQFDGVRGTVGRMAMVSEKQDGALAEGVGAQSISEVKLLASERSGEQHFGASVSLSGEWALVGAPKDDDNGVDSGAAYVYRWNGSSWQEEAKLIASDGAERDLFGNAVSLSGEVALVGSSPDYSKSAGAAYIFRFDGSTWQEEAKLTASDGQIGDGFGQSVSVSGSVALVAAPLDENGSSSGSVYIFRKSSDGNSWQEERKLTFEDGPGLDWLGDSVSIDGDVALIGASRSDSVYVYRWDGNEWQLEEKLLAKDASTGDYFGRSVSLSGDVALIGAPYDDDLAANAGSAYLFRFDGQSWQQEQKLQLNDESLSNHFGYSVSMSGELALVGSYGGTAYLYRLGDEGWQEEARLQPSDGGGNLFGESVSLDGEMALVGAAAADDAIAGEEAGAAYLYNLSSGNAPDITLFPASIRKIVNWKDSERLMIANVGTEALSWAASDTPSWLTASPASGTLAPGERLSVTIHMDATQLALGSYREQLTITTNDPDEPSLGVAILLTVMPYQHTFLPDDGPWDKFGHEVSLSGDVAIVGAPSYAQMQAPFSPGMAQIYRFDGRQWLLEQQLQASDWALGDRFGYSVEMSGDLAIVGAPGAASHSAYLFRWDGDQWQEEQKLVGSDERRHFASHVDISEDVAFIGAEGAVYVYRFDGSSWQLEQTLSASDENENSFGSSFSGSGNSLLVGAPEEDAGGVAYMYRFDGSSWIEEARLMASDAGEAHNFGVSVSLSDNKALVRAKNSAYFWRRHQNGNPWQEEARFAVRGGFSGFQSYNYNSVSLDGNRAVVQSADRFVTIFHWNGSSWAEEVNLLPIDRPGMGSFDSSLSLSGSTLLVGDAWQYGTDSAYLYDLSVKVPDITISRSDLSLALAEGTSRRERVTITNNTTETLVLQCEPGCTGNSWLAVSPISSTLPPMASQELLIDIDATTLNQEQYRHLLSITSATSPPLTPPNTRGGTGNSPGIGRYWGDFKVPLLVLGGLVGAGGRFRNGD